MTRPMIHAALYALLSLICLGGLVLTAHAQVDPDAFKNQREEVREALLERQDARRENQATGTASTSDEVRARVAEELEARNTTLAERLKVRIQNLFDNMARRMLAAIDRLKDIADRMESRIEKLEAAGVDGSAAYAFINEARTELNAAQDLIDDEFDAAIDDAITSENPRERSAGIRATFAEAATHIRTAHQALRNALAALKVATSGSGQGVSNAVSERPTSTQPTQE